MNSHRYRRDVFALLAYALLAILLTYPLVLYFTTHVAGDGSDDPALAWNLWWVPYSILNLNANPIYTNYMFYPIGLNLAFYTLTYLNAFLSIPLQFAFNLIVAANTNLLLSFTLSGFGAYLLSAYLLRRAQPEADPRLRALAAFVAGALYAFSSNKLLYASLGQFNIASSHWIPFYVLFLLKLTNARVDRRIALRYGFLLGLFLLFQALSEFIFASFLILFSVLYVAVWLVARWRAGEVRRVGTAVMGMIAGAIVFVVPMLPILTAMLRDMQSEGDFIQSGLGFADVFSSDLLGFFIPSRLNPLFRGLESQFHFAYTNFAFLGFAGLVLAIIAVWKVPAARVWGGLGVIFVLVTLGPEIRVNGTAFNTPFMPFNWLLQIPFVKGNRYPSRWSVMVTLALAILVGYAILWLARKVQVKNARLAIVLPLVLGALVLTEHLSLPLPLSDFSVPEIYKTIAADPEDFSVLEVPLAWRNGFRMAGTLDAAMMFEQWYQTVHRHPILGGNTSRNPELKFQYFTEAPVINSLIAVETGHTVDAAQLAQDRTLAWRVLRMLRVKYIVWHSPRNAENRAALEAARNYIEDVIRPQKIWDATDENGQVIAYRVNQNMLTTEPTADAQAAWSRLNFGEGWGAVGGPIPMVWATRDEAKLLIYDEWARTDPAEASLRLYAPMANQTVRVNANGSFVGEIKLQQGWGEYSLPLPAGAWQQGINPVTLQFGATTPVSNVPAANREIGKTGVTSPVSLLVRSAGNEIGDFAHIYVNGTDAALNNVGYNVVVLDPATGAVQASRSFNTFESEEESARLARFIGEIPSGKIVAVAVRDEASRYLSTDAVNALRSIGAEENLQGKWRWSHAIIGVKGAAPGTALEMASETMPAQLVVGVGANGPQVAAGLAWMRIELGMPSGK